MPDLVTEAVSATRTVFRRVDTDRDEWRSEDGRWLIERVFTEGPRGGTKGGRYFRWHLYEARSGRLRPVATEPRLGDIWGHIDV